ncbi:hypothetical protein HPB47_012248 [Ixodes persulcatus]|uniref:Uncharacterized protein n=1 Tax=Ixodes persulcatus TaxID=34615 RepID=A0AC60NU60_IXOPE|nr:hypothetical protein HPB47_012248 [Ixodes persulcatus]
MAADTSFTEFVDFVLRTNKLQHHSEDESLPVSRRRFRKRLNATEVLNACEVLARYCFAKATVASVLMSLSLEECEDRQSWSAGPSSDTDVD